MAETVARLTYVPESLGGFLGVNLRRDRMNLQDSDLARALNFDCHSVVGSPQVRAGRTVLLASLGGLVRQVLTLDTTRYTVAGTTLAKDGSPLLLTLDSHRR